MSERVTILGAGSWGMAVARLLDNNGAQVTMWEYNRDDFEKLIKFRNNPDRFSLIQLAPSITITNDLAQALDNPSLVVLAVPSQYLRSVLERINRLNVRRVGFVNLAKGIETTSLKRMSEIIVDILEVDPSWVATLSGPSHAEEVVRDMPTAVVAAGRSEGLIHEIQALFSSQSFRVYYSDDLVGVELGGSLKNIIAIAAGIAAGLGTGDNTLGALITRGLAEITRLGTAMGAQASTFSGLSGIGDLVTTCSSRHSRNRYVGEFIGRGEKLQEILARMTMVAEGVETTRSGYALALRYGVEMPITTQVYEVLFNDKPPADAVGDLMGRTLKPEIWQ